MDRRTLLAVALCFLIFMGWQKFYIEPRTPKPAPTSGVAQTPPTSSANSATIQQAPSTSGTSPSNSNATKSGEKQEHIKVPFENRTVKVSTGTAMVGNGSKIFTGWDLKSYRLGLAPEAAAVGLESVTHQQAEGEILFDHPDLAYLSDLPPQKFENVNGTLVWSYEDDKIKLTREITGNDQQPYVDLKISAQLKSARSSYLFLSLGSKVVADDPEEADRNLVYWTNQSIERVQLTDIPALKEVATSVKWAGVTSRYFLMSFVNQAPAEPRALIQATGEKAGKINLVYPISGNSIVVPLRVYFGPKELNLLRSVEPTLDHTIDFGWFTVFAYPLLKLMKWLYSVFHNYGIAIILLTILIKIITFPLTYKSSKSMKRMAVLQPQLQKLRDKHKDDKEALNREMLTVMRSHGYNPVAGCLPILIQMPVFFALYRVLYSSIELYHAPFYLWIQDLSYRDPYFVTPVLLSLTMFVQQKLTPATVTDPMQARMMQMMPLIFGAFMLTLPSGLTIYMLVNAITSILQQMVINKHLDGTSVPASAKAK